MKPRFQPGNNIAMKIPPAYMSCPARMRTKRRDSPLETRCCGSTAFQL